MLIDSVYEERQQTGWNIERDSLLVIRASAYVRPLVKSAIEFQVADQIARKQRLAEPMIPTGRFRHDPRTGLMMHSWIKPGQEVKDLCL